MIGVLLTLVISGLLTAVWYITRLPSWQLKEVEVVGGRTIPHNEIKNLVESSLNGTYLRLIPKRYTLLYPKDDIEKHILDLDRVKNVHLEKDDNNNLIVAFEEHVPRALWCAEVDSEGCVFVDINGYAFAKAPRLTGGAFVRYITDTEPKVETYLDPEYIKETEAFISSVESELSLFVTHVVRLGDYDTEYYVSGGGRIKVSQGVSSTHNFRNLKLVLDAEEFKHIEPGTFNYIDLRFGDKIFVNEVKADIATTTTSTTSTSQ